MDRWTCRNRECEEIDEMQEMQNDFNNLKRLESFSLETGSVSRDSIPGSDSNKKEDEVMAPLMMFLASSFNVELVYVILKGITQFSYLTCDDGQDDFIRGKVGKLNVKTQSNGSRTLTLNEIKIKNIDKWSTSKSIDH